MTMLGPDGQPLNPAAAVPTFPPGAWGMAFIRLPDGPVLCARFASDDGDLHMETVQVPDEPGATADLIHVRCRPRRDGHPAVPGMDEWFALAHAEVEAVDRLLAGIADAEAAANGEPGA